MSDAGATAGFAKRLPIVSQFLQAVDTGIYVALPAGWWVAVTDVVDSRAAIADGRYKAVNMAGAAFITATMNALGSRDVPFVFAGDGAAVAVADEDAALVREALADTAAWVRDEIGLELRAALVPVADIRAAGRDVLVTGVALSEAAHVYAFAGGGVTFAEARMKAGEFAVPPGPPSARPDLTGLSCRWAPMRAEGRRVVSLIVEPSPAHAADFPAIVEETLAFVRQNEHEGHPMPPDGPPLGWPPRGLDLEARARRRGSLLLMRLRLLAETIFATVIFATGWKVGDFDPAHYRRYTARNTDYRKFLDGLRMTVSLTPAMTAALRSRLEARRAEGLIEFGMAEQDSAIITCFVPQVTSDDHFHFLDGAGGGYAEAAARLGR